MPFVRVNAKIRAIELQYPKSIGSSRQDLGVVVFYLIIIVSVAQNRRCSAHVDIIMAF